ncbi:ankyrin-2-like [Nasonia vitripennis]|uniref:Uncharacterized protein n=1 Tax=Nasonia vitripennis TaxID=7425 RepID=A0A7M7LKX3_NASVI|nr:ankyrin-2-like [Nasonia vitripennis]
MHTFPINDLDVVRLEYLLNLSSKPPLHSLDVLRFSEEGKTRVLHVALRQENDCIEVVKLLLKRGASAKLKLVESGETAIHVAAKHCNDPVILRLLFDAGANVHATTRFENQTALHIAVRRCHQPVVEELLRRGIHIDAQTRNGNTALHMAVLKGSKTMVKLLLDRGADPNCQNDEKETPFTSSLGRFEDQISRLMLRTNIAKPVNVYLKNHEGEIALHSAALHCKSVAVFKTVRNLGPSMIENDSRLLFYAIANRNSSTRVELLRLLLESNSADPRSIVSRKGETMLHFAVRMGAVDVAEYLLDFQKLDINGKPGQKIPLFSALRNGDEAAVNLLLRHGAQTDLVDRQDCHQSPLHAAIAGFNDDEGELFRVCRKLIDRGTPLDHFDSNKQTALVTALLGGKKLLAELLIRRGANVRLATFEGLSPLHIASKKGLVNIVKKLLVAGASANDTRVDGKSVLEYATSSSDNSSWDSVKLLLEYGANCRADGGALVSALIEHKLEILRLLLSHGADVNLEYQGKVPLAYAIDTNSSDSIKTTECLLKYIALLDSQGRPVHQENLKLIRGSVRFQNFYNRCILELESMRSTPLDQEFSVTYFDLLTGRDDSIECCLRYRKLKIEVIGKLKFDIYFGMILNKWRVGLRRLSMLEKLRAPLVDALINRLPCELIEMICAYFSDQELEACGLDSR